MRFPTKRSKHTKAAIHATIYAISANEDENFVDIPYNLVASELVVDSVEPALLANMPREKIAPYRHANDDVSIINMISWMDLEITRLDTTARSAQ